MSLCCLCCWIVAGEHGILSILQWIIEDIILHSALRYLYPHRFAASTAAHDQTAMIPRITGLSDCHVHLTWIDWITLSWSDSTVKLQPMPCMGSEVSEVSPFFVIQQQQEVASWSFASIQGCWFLKGKVRARDCTPNLCLFQEQDQESCESCAFMLQIHCYIAWHDTCYVSLMTNACRVDILGPVQLSLSFLVDGRLSKAIDKQISTPYTQIWCNM